MFFYLINNNEKHKNRHIYVITALVLFLIGDIIIISEELSAYFLISLFCFLVGKMFYIFRFSNQNDFKLIRLLPILIFCFVYMFVVFSMIYDNLGSLFLPVLIYLFMTMIILQFAFLRKSEVNYTSYLLVGIGILLSFFAESIAVLDMFYESGFLNEKLSVILLYSISQYLIVLGIVLEKIEIDNTYNLDF